MRHRTAFAGSRNFPLSVVFPEASCFGEIVSHGNGGFRERRPTRVSLGVGISIPLTGRGLRRRAAEFFRFLLLPSISTVGRDGIVPSTSPPEESEAQTEDNHKGSFCFVKHTYKDPKKVSKRQCA